MKKHFLSIDDISRSETFEIFELAKKLRKNPHGNQFKHKIFALFFKYPLPWSELSFKAGIKQLDGSIIYLNHSTTDQLFKEKALEDMIKSLEKHVDAIIMGAFSQTTLQNIPKYSDLPVINAVSDLESPCQVISDLFTIKEKFEDFEGLKLAYVGDGNNICNSLLLGCSKVGMDIYVACPRGFEPNKKILELARNYSKITKSRVVVETEPKATVENANIIYNDTFVSMGDEKETKKRLSIFLPKYQVTTKLFKFASPDAVYMRPLPAYRGVEVTSEVIDGQRSIVFDQVENKLHAQKALLIKMMGPIILNL